MREREKRKYLPRKAVTQMQYAAVVAVVCVIGYVIAGFVRIRWITLGVSAAMLLTVLTFMKKYNNSGESSVNEKTSD